MNHFGHIDTTMLLGEHREAVNSRGQLLIPAQVLDELDGDLVVARGFESNLILFPAREWRERVARLLAEPISDPDVRALRRRLFSAAVELSPDANGRITLPDSLREFAGINGEVIFAGLYDHVELWSVDRWLPVLEAAESSSDEGLWNDIGI